MTNAILPTNIRAQLKQIYDLYRTGLLNQLYYADRLNAYQQKNKWVEITQAIGTSSALGAWSIFKDGAGSHAWVVIAGVATIISIIKPFLQWSKEIEKYGQLSIGYTGLYLDLKRIVAQIAVEQAIQDSVWKDFG